MQEEYSTARMNRSRYAFIYVSIVIVTWAVGQIAGNFILDPKEAIFALVSLIVVSSFVLIMFSIDRCHDRDRSGYFALLFLVPVLCLWPTVELLFFRGTVGPNKYGPDPLEVEAAEAAEANNVSVQAQPVKEASAKKSIVDEDAKAIQDLKGLCALTQTAASVLTMRGYNIEISVQSTPKGVTITPRISKEF